MKKGRERKKIMMKERKKEEQWQKYNFQEEKMPRISLFLSVIFGTCPSKQKHQNLKYK